MRFYRPQSLTTRPTVSVVVPCYNYGHFLSTAVGSALDQRGVELDIIVVDDASTDGSVEVARRLAQHPNVRLITHDDNRGHIATYNDGLAEIKGDYVVLLSADDALPRNALTRAVALMEEWPNVGLVYGFPDNFTDTPPPVRDHTRSWTIWAGLEWQRRICRTGRNPIMSPEVVMRRSAWDEIGEYDARLPHAADMAMWLDTSLRWDIGRVNGPAQALYRVHGSNMHLTTYAGEVPDLEERMRVFDQLFTEGRPLPADAIRRHAAAQRAIAASRERVEKGASGSSFRHGVERVSASVHYRMWRRYGL